MTKDQIKAAWIKFYDTDGKDETLGDEDFHSLCIGFCCALGLSVKEAFDLYEDMIQLGKY